MTYEISDIVSMCTEIDKDRVLFNAYADVWEDTYALKAFSETSAERFAKEGIEQVVLPTPQNVVNMTRRLISDDVRVVIPPRGEASADEDDRILKVQEWLMALYPANNTQYRTQVVSDLSWQSAVLGRHVLEVKWIREKLPQHRRVGSMPIMMRVLDPRNCGVLQGPLYTIAAYHKIKYSVKEIRQIYPEYFGDGRTKKVKTFREKYLENTEDITRMVQVTDFWWVDEDTGKVWNAVLLDDWDFAVEPWETKYPEVPIIEGLADSSPSSDEVLKSLSILAPIVDLWKFQCRMISMSGTGLAYTFMPLLLAKHDGTGGDMPELTQSLIPNTINYIPPGYDIIQVSPQVNLQLLNSVFQQVDAASQQSTYPGVMYGQAPGDIQAGFGVNLLRDQAQGRIKTIRHNLEATLSTAHRIVLGLVESLGGSKGVTLWGFNEGEKSPFSLTLKKEDIGGQYENRVRLAPAVPSDTTQRQTMGMQMASGRMISDSTFRDHFMGDIELPRDEDVRIALEDAIKANIPGMMEKRSIRAMQEYYGMNEEALERAIVGTGLWDVYQAEKQWAQQKEMDMQAQAVYDETGMAPPGYHVMNDGSVMPDSAMPGPGPQGQQPMPGGPMPPGMSADIPPGQGQGMPLQPEAMVPTELPPQMQGQLTPQDLGLDLNDPMVQQLYAQLIGQGLSDAQVQNVLLERFRRK